MGDHPNVERMRKGYEAFQSGDMAALNDLFSDDIVWHQPGTSPLSGDYKGKEEVFGLFGKFIQETDGTFKIAVEDMFANDHKGVALQRVTADRNGKHLDNYNANIFAYNDDGKVTEVWGMSVDTQTGSEFFA